MREGRRENTHSRTYENMAPPPKNNTSKRSAQNHDARPGSPQPLVSPNSLSLSASKKHKRNNTSSGVAMMENVKPSISPESMMMLMDDGDEDGGQNLEDDENDASRNETRLAISHRRLASPAPRPGAAARSSAHPRRRRERT